MTNLASNVTLFSCSHPDWIRSSYIMGENLSNAMQGATVSVISPANAVTFTQTWKSCRGAVIIHTHGSAVGLYNAQDGQTPLIISNTALHSIPINPAIRIVVITACSTASSAEAHPIAEIFSRLIHPDGIVIANQHTVFGASDVFYAENRAPEWVTYSNGHRILSPNKMPSEIDMSYVYQTYCEQNKRRNALFTHAFVSVIGCRNPGWMSSSLEMGRIVSDAIGCSGDLAVKCPANEEEFSRLWQLLDFSVM